MIGRDQTKCFQRVSCVNFEGFLSKQINVLGQLQYVDHHAYESEKSSEDLLLQPLLSAVSCLTTLPVTVSVVQWTVEECRVSMRLLA